MAVTECLRDAESEKRTLPNGRPRSFESGRHITISGPSGPNINCFWEQTAVYLVERQCPESVTHSAGRVRSYRRVHRNLTSARSSQRNPLSSIPSFISILRSSITSLIIPKLMGKIECTFVLFQPLALAADCGP